jgi:cysteinyl-tRNA synthetase
MSRSKEAFKPINEGHVGLYSCGPTVYWYQHIGNLRSYVFADVLKRVLMYNGFDVKHVINVTDVGHLTSDGDDGDDKIEKAAAKEHKKASEIARFYFDEFQRDFERLNIIEPFKWSWASKHIKEQVDMVATLEKKGFAYKTSDGIYFDTSKVADYGKLARLKVEGLEAGKRIGMREKKNKTDFALWKFSNEPGKRQQEWKSPWGLGFPGWHIECSAMSSKYLGKQFDIHTGGEDHIGVHHTNEIAQSEATFGKKPWVNYWMHGAFLNLKGGKMSKSSGKIKTIGELEKEGVAPLAYRYFTYTAHYRKPLSWNEDAVASAVSSYRRLRNVIAGIENKVGVNKRYLKEFEARINDDLDMPGALAVLWKLVRDEKAEGKIGTIKKMDKVFGLRLLEVDRVEIPDDVRGLAEERETARNLKDWTLADDLRRKIEAEGWVVKDGKDGFELEER